MYSSSKDPCHELFLDRACFAVCEGSQPGQVSPVGGGPGGVCVKQTRVDTNMNYVLS